MIGPGILPSRRGSFCTKGKNVIAVVVKNVGGAGGINHGVSMEVADKPTPSEWKRSAFNGLAEVILQGSKKAKNDCFDRAF